MINKDHLDEAGLEVPPLDWTWEDYREYSKALTQGEGKDKTLWIVFPYMASVFTSRLLQ